MTRFDLRGVALVTTLLLALAPVPALAKSPFKGLFGDVKFKAKKFAVGCSYFRSSQLFDLIGSQSKRRGRLQSGASAAGYGADPTAPGTVFPIVLTGTTATFFHGTGISPPMWTGNTGLGDTVVLTLTGYTKGKVSGTLVATLHEGALPGGAEIQVDATFAAKCTVQ